MNLNRHNTRRPLALLAKGAIACALVVAFQGAAFAADAKRCLVVHVTQKDDKIWAQALNIAANVPKALGMDNVRVEVVAQGPGLGLLTAASPMKARVSSLSHYGTTFSACGNTMKAVAKKTGKMPKLGEGVREVPAGVLRVMELQEEGCSYVRP